MTGIHFTGPAALDAELRGLGVLRVTLQRRFDSWAEPLDSSTPRRLARPPRRAGEREKSRLSAQNDSVGRKSEGSRSRFNWGCDFRCEPRVAIWSSEFEAASSLKH